MRLSPQPWHDLTEGQKRQAIADGLGKPIRRGVYGRPVIEEGWRWMVNDKGRVTAVKPADRALADFHSPQVPRKRLQGEP